MNPIEYGDYIFYSDCRIWSKLKVAFISGNNGNDWYPCVVIDGEKEYVHRIIAQLFIPNPYHYKYVNHKDGNKLNFAVSNLEWTNGSGNAIHAFKSGLKKSLKGQDSGRSKIRDIHIPVIREAIRLGFKQKEIARYFNVGSTTISSINIGRIWKHIP